MRGVIRMLIVSRRPCIRLAKMKLALNVEIQCGKCGFSIFETTDKPPADPVFVCTKCGNAIGPKSSINSRLRGEECTPLNASFVLKENSR
jgi:hypothetical protein